MHDYSFKYAGLCVYAMATPKASEHFMLYAQHHIHPTIYILYIHTQHNAASINSKSGVLRLWLRVRFCTRRHETQLANII